MKELFKNGTRVKIISGGDGAYGCNDCEGIITNKKFVNGSQASNINVEIVAIKNNSYANVGEIWGLAKDYKLEVIKTNIEQYEYESMPFLINFKVTDKDKNITYQTVDTEYLEYKLIINNTTTIVIFKDGSKGVSKCLPKDVYDMDKGIDIAYKKALIKSYQKELKELVK